MANPPKKALGKGLSAIITTSMTPVETIEKVIEESNVGKVIELDVNSILPNPDQPRLIFNETELRGLADSIISVGLIQPIIVRKHESNYFVVAGERRLRASKMAGMGKIKAVIIETTEEENLSMALIENIQRANLDPIEEAKAYRLLIKRFQLKQADVAKRVGKERATVANMLRLLSLQQEIQTALSEKKINIGHAKLLLSVEDENRRLDLFNDVVAYNLSVRDLNKLISDKPGEEKNKGTEKTPAKKEAQVKKMEEKLKAVLGTKVEIKASGKKGKIEISYYSLDDFDRILELLHIK